MARHAHRADINKPEKASERVAPTNPSHEAEPDRSQYAADTAVSVRESLSPRVNVNSPLIGGGESILADSQRENEHVVLHDESADRSQLNPDLTRSEDSEPARKDADVIRSMIVAENGQVHNRVTWFATIEGLLFTALGFAVSNHSIQTEFIVAIAVLGILVAVISMSGLCGCTVAIFELRLWQHEKHRNYDGPPVIGLDPPFWAMRVRQQPQNAKRPCFTVGDRILWFMTPWNWMPIGLVFGWLMVLRASSHLRLRWIVLGTLATIAFMLFQAVASTASWSKRNSCIEP